MVKYLLKECDSDQAIAEHDASILRYMQPASMTPQQCVDKIIAKSDRVVDVCDEGTLDDVAIDGVDSPI